MSKQFLRSIVRIPQFSAIHASPAGRVSQLNWLQTPPAIYGPSASGRWTMCLFFLAILLSPSFVVADKADDDFKLAVGFYRGQRWEQAAETFGDFIKEFPQHPRVNIARLYHAMSLSSLNRYAPARDQFAAFIKAEPDGKNTADARYRLGECSYYLKD